MTYRQLVEAYNSAIEGPRAPILIAVNSVFCEWWAQAILMSFVNMPGYGSDAMTTRRAHEEVERIRQLRSALFYGTVMVFRPAIPEGEIWCWFADAKLKAVKL